MTPDTTVPLTELLAEFRTLSASEPALPLQALAMLACLLVGWLLARQLRPRLQRGLQWRAGHEGLSRVLSPLTAWLLLEGVRHLWPTGHGHGHSLLKIGAAVMAALVLVRMLIYLLRESLPQARWLARFEHAIAGTIWFGLLLHITGVLSGVLAQLDAIAFTIGGQKVSVLTVTSGILSVAGTLLIALWLGRLIENQLTRFDGLDLSARAVIVKFAKTLLLVLAVMIALPLVGIPLSMLSVFGGALGVGLGFGLQKIASNYVSGFIILLDRAVRIGDLVQIDTRQGTVTAITARYVVLKLSDGSEAIIPNETLITSTVLNLSYNDRRQRLTVAVPVAHEADLGRALTLMSEQAMQDLRLLEAPPPQAIIKAMSRDCIELELGFWIEDPSLGAAAIKSDLYLAITSAFRDAGIPPPAVRTG